MCAQFQKFMIFSSGIFKHSVKNHLLFITTWEIIYMSMYACIRPSIHTYTLSPGPHGPYMVKHIMVEYIKSFFFYVWNWYQFPGIHSYTQTASVCFRYVTISNCREEGYRYKEHHSTPKLNVFTSWTYVLLWSEVAYVLTFPYIFFLNRILPSVYDVVDEYERKLSNKT